MRYLKYCLLIMLGYFVVLSSAPGQDHPEIILVPNAEFFWAFTIQDDHQILEVGRELVEAILAQDPDNLLGILPEDDTVYIGNDWWVTHADIQQVFQEWSAGKYEQLLHNMRQNDLGVGVNALPFRIWNTKPLEEYFANRGRRFKDETIYHRLTRASTIIITTQYFDPAGEYMGAVELAVYSVGDGQSNSRASQVFEENPFIERHGEEWKVGSLFWGP